MKVLPRREPFWGPNLKDFVVQIAVGVLIVWLFNITGLADAIYDGAGYLLGLVGVE